jgi:hypothetical protein
MQKTAQLRVQQAVEGTRQYRQLQLHRPVPAAGGPHLLKLS